MEELNNVNQEQQVNYQDQQEAPQEQVQEQYVQEEQKEPTEPENDYAKNMRALREKAERLEKERDEALRSAQQSQPQSHPEEDDDFSFDPNELAEGKHLNKVSKKIKKLESELKQYQQQSTYLAAENKIKSNYPDFDQVVNTDTLKTLKTTHPELAQAIDSSPDLYSKAVSAYTMIKKLEIKPDSYFDADKERAKANSSKPRPAVSLAPQGGESPLSRANAFANGLTDELKEQLRKEMADAVKFR